ncbi:MAG: hypothetical protein GXP09_08200 [Gammaproteobacteria bacterium]|nr:hypothetical protein [Gammaproteobacteria bacterium]
MADTRFIVVLSDIHIGTNSPTNWYQAGIHGPYVQAILNYLITHADQIKELILLGDFVDLWTYLPSETPPTFAEIVQNTQNKSLFNIIRTLVDKIEKVSFVNGNHDMTVTADDLKLLSGLTTQKQIYLQPDLYKPLGNGTLVCTHGHHFSMMCAPYKDSKNIIAPLPVGYYATRAGAYYAELQLKKTGKKNVAELPGTGEPTGIGLTVENFAEIVVDAAVHSVGYAIMSAIQKATGLDWYTKIVMPDNHASRSLDDADEDFHDLFASFEKSLGPDGKPLGTEGAWDALLHSDIENNLSSYAGQLASVHHAKIVVMGHTHVPRENEKLRVLNVKDTAQPLPFIYANSGFNCPALPDIHDEGKIPTFVSIGIDEVTNFPESIEHRGVRKGADGQYHVDKHSLLGPLVLCEHSKLIKVETAKLLGD